MSTLVISDLQLDDNPRNSYRHKFMRDLPKVLSDTYVDSIVILGDLTEEKDRHSAWLVNSIVDYVVTLSDWGEVYVLLGNHDYLDLDQPYFAFLKYLKNVTYITEPSCIRIEGLGLCGFLPHTRNYKRDWKPEFFEHSFKASDGKTYLSKLDFIFAHQTFAGADGGHARELEGVPLSALPKGVKVISGDVHIPQQHGQVTYVGAPYTVDFGDQYEPRMLELVGKTKGMKVLRVEIRSIPCTGPQKRLVQINAASGLSKELRSYRKGDILKIRVRLLPEDVQWWSATQRNIRKQAEGMGFVVDAILPVMEQVEGKRLRVTTDQPKDDRQIVTAFAKQREVDNRTLETGYLLMEKTK